MKRLVSAVLSAAVLCGALFLPARISNEWLTGEGPGWLSTAVSAAAEGFSWNGVWQYSAIEQQRVGDWNPLAGPGVYQPVSVTETITVSPFHELKDFTFQALWEKAADDGENIKQESRRYLGVSGPWEGGAGKTALSLLPFDETSGGVSYSDYYVLYETDAGDIYCSDNGKTYSRLSEGPREEGALEVSGVALGADGKALPRMQMTVDVYLDAASIPARWQDGLPDLSEALATDLNGAYSVRIPLPGDMRTQVGVVTTLAFRCRLPQGDAFFLGDFQEPDAQDEIRVSTLALVGPSDAMQALEDLHVVPVARAIQFADIPNGRLTMDDDGLPEPMQCNLGDSRKLLGCICVYRLLWDAFAVGGVFFDELAAMLRTPSGQPLRVDVNYLPNPGVKGDRSHYDVGINAIRLTEDRCRYDDISRFTVLHEFGHFFDAATNGWKHRCKHLLGDINHGGYLNASTADSFIEGFATWFACVCQLYRRDANPYALGPFGLEEPRDWRAWAGDGTNEELSIASVLIQAMSLYEDAPSFWKEILQPDLDSFYQYYRTLAVVFGEGSEKRTRLDRHMIDAGLFAMPSGNGRYDPGEPYRDMNGDGSFSPGTEPYGDLMFHLDPSARWIDTSGYPDPLALKGVRVGSTGAHNFPGRQTLAWPDNQFVALEGEPVDSLKVTVRFEDGGSYAYVAAMEDRGVFVGLPNGPRRGAVEVSVPGGGVVFRGDVSGLQGRIAQTAGQSAPLASAYVRPSDLAPAGTLTAPTGGDPEASGVFETLPLSNGEASLMAEDYRPEEEIDALFGPGIASEFPGVTEAPWAEETDVPWREEALPEDAEEAWPEGIGSLSAIVDVAAGKYFTLGLRQNGTVAAVGDNSKGQCGVEGWRGVIAVSAGLMHSIGLRGDGTVAAAGDNELGQCGVEDWTDIVAISAGYGHTVGLRADGTVVAAGYNGDGQLDVSGWKDIVSVAAGGWHTVGLTRDGRVVAAGYDNYGQCDVRKWEGILAIAAGGWNTLGIREDGTVAAVGYGDRGQLDLDGWSDMMTLSASGYHTVGLDAYGTALAAGNDDEGQCAVNRWTGVSDIAAGGYHTVVLFSDGLAVAVGSDEYGQCGVYLWNE